MIAFLKYKGFEMKDHTHVQIIWIMVMKLFINTRKCGKKSFDLSLNSIRMLFMK